MRMTLAFIEQRDVEQQRIAASYARSTMTCPGGWGRRSVPAL